MKQLENDNQKNMTRELQTTILLKEMINYLFGKLELELRWPVDWIQSIWLFWKNETCNNSFLGFDDSKELKKNSELRKNGRFWITFYDYIDWNESESEFK